MHLFLVQNIDLQWYQACLLITPELVTIYLYTGTDHFQGKSNVQESNRKKSRMLTYMRTSTIIENLCGKGEISMHLEFNQSLISQPRKGGGPYARRWNIGNQDFQTRLTRFIQRDIDAFIRRRRLNDFIKVGSRAVFLCPCATTLPANVLLDRLQKRSTS